MPLGTIHQLTNRLLLASSRFAQFLNFRRQSCLCPPRVLIIPTLHLLLKGRFLIPATILDWALGKSRTRRLKATDNVVFLFRWFWDYSVLSCIFTAWITRNMDYFYQIEDKDGVRFSWNVWPSTKQEAANLVIPLGCMYTPLKRCHAPMVHYEPIMCKGSCKSFLNPFWCVKLERFFFLW